MARGPLTTFAATLAVLLVFASGAQARTPCPSETAAPNAQNAAQVSDAIVCLTNQIRTHYGLPALRRDERLDTAARLHSEDMAERGYFGHNTPEGLTPSDRTGRQGYPENAGENIANGFPNARVVVLGWMASAGHCRNVLSSATDIGVGVATSPKVYYTQNLGDYSSPVSQTPRNGCPFDVVLDEIADLLPANGEDKTAPAGEPGDDDGAAEPQPAAPVTGATLSSIGLSRSRFRAGGRGTSIFYTLSADATVSFRVERERDGRRDGSRCVAVTRETRSAKPCTRYKFLPGKLIAAGTAGANALRFTGRLRGKKLKPGRYRLRALVAGGGAPARVLFEIKSGR